MRGVGGMGNEAEGLDVWLYMLDTGHVLNSSIKDCRRVSPYTFTKCL